MKLVTAGPKGDLYGPLSGRAYDTRQHAADSTTSVPPVEQGVSDQPAAGVEHGREKTSIPVSPRHARCPVTMSGDSVTKASNGERLLESSKRASPLSAGHR